MLRRSSVLSSPDPACGRTFLRRRSRGRGASRGCADRCWCPRSPCIRSSGGYACRCRRPSSPCIVSSGGYPSRLRRPRSPCIRSSSGCQQMLVLPQSLPWTAVRTALPWLLLRLCSQMPAPRSPCSGWRRWNAARVRLHVLARV
jgi:hypothetical protein